MALWKPTNDSTLYAWYNETGLGSAGANVTTWSDQSGNSRDLSESGATSATVTSGTVNGIKGVQFVETASLKRSSFVDLDSQDFLMACFVRDNNVDDTELGAPFVDLGTANGGGFGLFFTDFGTFLALTVNKQSGSVNINTISNASEMTEIVDHLGEGLVFTLFRQGSTVKCRANGVEIISVTESPSSTNAEALNIGAYDGAAANDTVSLQNYETHFYLGSSISDELVEEVEGYMLHRFGKDSQLAASHSYKQHAPTESLEIAGTAGGIEGGLTQSVSSELTTVRI